MAVLSSIINITGAQLHWESICGCVFYFYTMRILCCCLAFFLSASLFAQKQDYTWVIGHDYNFDDDKYGRIVINFSSTPPSVEYLVGDVNMNMFVTNVSISDTFGNLMFYSNGYNIANENGQIVPNGEGLNPGAFHNQLCDVLGRGYGGGYASAVILPLPDNDSIFYMFHQSVKYIPPPQEDAYVDRLLFSTVKAKSNERLVLEKNIPVIIDSLAFGEMNAVKHANGKDWWIILPRRNSNQFYIFLFTKEGIVDTLTQTIGNVPLPVDEGYGQTTFSPYGDKMIRYYPTNKVWAYDFDRSLGVFTGFSTINLNTGISIAFDGGCAISPNGRFLYIAALTNIYQFDLTASNISSSQTTVATWDGFVDPIGVTFWHSQLGPDCKIYIVGGGDLRYYHIIHNPDEPGLACNVEQRGMVLPVPCGASIPYFPNYRLGPIDNPGLPCSPVVGTTQPNLPHFDVSVFPNPANNQVTFSTNESSSGIRQLNLFDVYGHLLKRIAVSGASESYTLPVGDVPSGIYFWELSFGRETREKGRLIIQH